MVQEHILTKFIKLIVSPTIKLAIKLIIEPPTDI